jgi:hypothetical protein
MHLQSISVCSSVWTDMSRSALIGAILLRHIFIHQLHNKRTWAVRLTMQVHMQHHWGWYSSNDLVGPSDNMRLGHVKIVYSSRGTIFRTPIFSGCCSFDPSNVIGSSMLRLCYCQLFFYRWGIMPGERDNLPFFICNMSGITPQPTFVDHSIKVCWKG